MDEPACLARRTAWDSRGRPAWHQPPGAAAAGPGVSSFGTSVSEAEGAMRQHIHMSQASSGRQLMVTTVDYHTEGEPFRIVSGGIPPLVGRTILEKRRYALEHLDHIRQLLVFEPRGHADMYGGFVTEPEDDGAQLGVVFFHNAGYSTACGHGTIALVTWAIEAAIVPGSRPSTEGVVDASSGRLIAVGSVPPGRVRS